MLPSDLEQPRSLPFGGDGYVGQGLGGIRGQMYFPG